MRESRGYTRGLSNRGTAEFRSEIFRAQRRRKFFCAVAKHAYPKGTARKVRELTRRPDGRYEYGERTVYDWLEGRTEAPMSITMRIIGGIYSD
jgi:hypothetical protein